MNKQEAREILSLYRPGSADEADPFFQEARQLAESDPELARWFEAHRESYLALRQKFQSIPVPPGLKEQILSERKVHRPNFFQRYTVPILAMAAVLVFILSIDFAPRFFDRSTDNFAAYRKRMTQTALRSYSMDLLASDPMQVRGFLKSKNAPADFSLPPGLKAAALIGCVVSTWQGKPVSMICFKSGRPLPPGDQSDLWLFVIHSKDLPQAPSVPPLVARVNKAITASWSEGKNTYLLAAVGNEAYVRKYLQ
jgi:hypothetical protein